VTGRIIITELTLTKRSAPSEWGGRTHDRRNVYMRYRDGVLTIKIGPDGDARSDAAKERGTRLFHERIGEDWDATLKYKELVSATMHIVKWPEREPRLFNTIRPTIRLRN
jgi:hypothetical protein